MCTYQQQIRDELKAYAMGKGAGESRGRHRLGFYTDMNDPSNAPAQTEVWPGWINAYAYNVHVFCIRC